MPVTGNPAGIGPVADVEVRGERVPMYYRMTRLHREEDRYEELLGWARSIQEQVESLDGLLAAHLIESGPDNGMIIAAYRDEATASSAAAADLMGEVAAYTNRTPHGHEGTVVHSYGSG